MTENIKLIEDIDQTQSLDFFGNKS